MELTASTIASVTGGRLHGPDVVVSGAGIDSREIAAGQLFVALRAERDGHDFVPAAVAAGATACLCEVASDAPGWAPTWIEVPDVRRALDALGHHARSLLGDRVVGITGSVGKTSAKDLAASILATQWPTWASQRSFNNEIGVPLTLLGAPAGDGATVVEMGMRGQGHIAHLCGIAQPTMGVVTAVAMVHTELLGGIDGVAIAKREIIETLPANGYAVLNSDDPRVAAMASHTDATVVRFGVGGNVAAEHIELDDNLRPRFRLVSDWGSVEVTVAARGVHQVTNALAAAAVGMVWGVEPEAVALGLATATLSPWRMEVGRTPGGALVINDAYNASPTSTEAALHTLAAVPAHRHVAVLGTMAELGELGPAEHARIAGVAHGLGIRVVAVNEEAYGVDELVPDAAAAVAALGRLGPDDAVLVKASRSVGLEAVAHDLLGA